MSNAGRTPAWRCAGPALPCWRQPTASAGLRPKGNFQHCGRLWQLTTPSMLPTALLNRLLRPHNLDQPAMPAEQISTKNGASPEVLRRQEYSVSANTTYPEKPQEPSFSTSKH